MSSPTISPKDVAEAIPGARDIEHVGDGGQKRVFRASIAGQVCAVKFMRPTVESVATSELVTDASLIDDVTARARREVETLQQCRTPHLVKAGPVGLASVTIRGERLLYFTEEFIDGESLSTVLKSGTSLPIRQLVALATQITSAIEELWSFHKIHRDVKPGNIMRRSSEENFVLLDMGLVFDLDDRSLSLNPVGTVAYFSPEQLDFANRRSILDFRSDLFSLGVVLYQMATRQHPFTVGAANSWEVFTNIQTLVPRPPIELRADLPDEVNAIILRLLGKRPALRYRTTRMLLDALGKVRL